MITCIVLYIIGGIFFSGWRYATIALGKCDAPEDPKAAYAATFLLWPIVLILALGMALAAAQLGERHQ